MIPFVILLPFFVIILVQEGVFKGAKQRLKVAKIFGRREMVIDWENMIIIEAGTAFETFHTRSGRIDRVKIEKVVESGRTGGVFNKIEVISLLVR